MDEIVKFLNEQWDRREAAALSAKGDTAGAWGRKGSSLAADIVLYDKGGKLTGGHFRHIEANDPEYVLADIAAKRKILAACIPDHAASLANGGDSTELATEVLYGFASPFAGQLGYRQEWAA